MFYTGPLLVATMSVSCDSGGGPPVWQAEATTFGWLSSATFNMWETASTPGWNEEHSMLSVAYAPDGSWDSAARDLVALGDTDGDGYSNGSYVPDVSTLFDCDVHAVQPVMTYAVRVYDVDGNFADCAIFATDPTGVPDVLSSPSEGWYNPVSNAFEIASCVPFF